MRWFLALFCQEQMLQKYSLKICKTKISREFLVLLQVDQIFILIHFLDKTWLSCPELIWSWCLGHFWQSSLTSWFISFPIRSRFNHASAFHCSVICLATRRECFALSVQSERSMQWRLQRHSSRVRIANLDLDDWEWIYAHGRAIIFIINFFISEHSVLAAQRIQFPCRHHCSHLSTHINFTILITIFFKLSFDFISFFAATSCCWRNLSIQRDCRGCGPADCILSGFGRLQTGDGSACFDSRNEWWWWRFCRPNGEEDSVCCRCAWRCLHHLWFVVAFSW